MKCSSRCPTHNKYLENVNFYFEQLKTHALSSHTTLPPHNEDKLLLSLQHTADQKTNVYQMRRVPTAFLKESCNQSITKCYARPAPLPRECVRNTVLAPPPPPSKLEFPFFFFFNQISRWLKFEQPSWIQYNPIFKGLSILQGIRKQQGATPECN